MTIQRRYAPISGRFETESLAGLTGISTRDLEQIKIGGKGYRFSQGKLTFDVFAEKYLEQHSKFNRSCRCDKDNLRVHLTPFFGRHRIAEITTGIVREYINRRRGEKTYRGTMTSPATVNREMALLKSMFNRALEWEDITGSGVNWRQIKKFDEYGRERTLSADEFSRLMEAAAKIPHLRDFILIALNTGMRRGEILGMRWEQVDLKARVISIPSNSRKNRKPLLVSINQTLVDILLDIPRLGDYVFVNGRTGERLKALSRSFKTACRMAKKDPKNEDDPGIVGLRIHDLRHTFGTALAQAGVGTRDISKALGHSSEAVTKRYINLMDDRLQDAVDKLNGRFGAKRRQTDDTPPVETPASDTIN